MKKPSPSKTRPAPTRSYNLSSRRQKQADLKERIAAAAAALHASKGADKTSYSNIAQLAGVSLPTVHSYFPTENDLFLGCTSHVANGAPTFNLDKILKATELTSAIKILVVETEKQHLHFEPWLARRMDSYIPFLADMTINTRKQQTLIMRSIIQKFLGAGKHTTIAASFESILSFDLWYRLVRGHKLSLAEGRKTLVKSLNSIIEPSHNNK